MKAIIFIPDGWIPPKTRPGLRIILPFFLFLLIVFNSNGQWSKYPIVQINAQLVDTARYTLCELPYNVSNKTPGTNEFVKWKVVKGTVDIYMDDKPGMTIRDIKPDTNIVTYTIFNADSSVKEIDTLVVIVPDGGCGVIDKMGVGGTLLCGQSITLNSKLKSGYGYNWNVFPFTGASISNNFTESVTVTFNAAGFYTIQVTATSPSGYNFISDFISVNVYCDNADAGPDVAVNPCSFPFYLSGGNTPPTGATVKWEVVSGNAVLNFANTKSPQVLDASNGTVLRYTITNGPSSASDEMKITVNSVTLTSNICRAYVATANNKCGDIISVSTDWPASAGYTYDWNLPAGVSLINSPGSSPKLQVAAAGTYMIDVTVTSPHGYNSFTKKVVFTVKCETPVTQANAGPDITIYPCDFPLLITGNAPASDESVLWEVVSGSAVLQNANTRTVRVMDATNGTQLKYTITKGSVSSSDIMIVNVNSIVGFMCEPYISNPNPKCADEITVYFNWGAMGNYNFTWNTSTGLSIVGFPSSYYATIKVNQPGSHFINVNITSPGGYHSFVKTINLNVANCNQVTQANAGPDISHPFCDFPITLAGNTPTAGETVKWEVIKGSAVMKNANTQFPTLVDASHNSQFKYTITNSTTGASSSDTMNFILHYPNTVCPPFVSDTTPSCGDTITVYFPGVDTSYHFEWYGDDFEEIDISGDTAKFKVLKEGKFTIAIDIRTPNKYSILSRYVEINATCVKDPVTIADAGQDRFIKPCEFPYLLVGNAPKSTETVKWEVISGMAMLQQDNLPSVQLLDATYGTKIKYTISNGSESSSDTITVYIDPNTFFGCDPYVSNPAPKCGDTIKVHFNWNNFSYDFKWEISSGLAYDQFIPFNSSYASIIVKEGGIQTIKVTIKTPFDLNTFTKEITINAICPTITKANAGQDATAYCHSFQLSGNQPGLNETGKWNIIEGNAVIDNVNSPTATISGYTSSKVVLTWTITNNPLSSVDTVVITVNPLKVLVSVINHATCAANDGYAMAQATGGLAPYKVQWHGAVAGNELKNVASGKYYVTVTDQSGCTVVDSAVIEDKCVGNGLYTLEGDVTGGGQLLNYGLAILMQDIGGLPIPVKTTHLVNGHYKFTGVAKGDYLVYILPYKDKELTELHDLYLPTFYVNKVSIFFANPVHVVGNTYSVDIKLVEKKQWMMGTSSLTASLSLRSSAITPMLPVLLFNDNNELVSCGYYDGNSVSFGNLAPGTYYMSMSIEGVGYKNSQKVQVGTNDTNVNVGLDVTGINDKHEGTLRSVHAFPNPFNESLIVDLVNEFNGVVVVKFIEGVSGREIKEVQIGSPVAPVEIETSELPAGMYLLQIKAGDEVKVIPVVK